MSNNMHPTKIKIIEAMYELISKKGYDETSVSEICKIVGIKKPSLYYHFKSKEDLFVVTYQHMIWGYESPFSKEELDKLTSQEAYKNFVIDKFAQFIESDGNNERYRRIQMEFYIQANRIEKINQLKEKLNAIMKGDLKQVIHRGIELEVIPENVEVDALIGMIYTFTNGIDMNITFNLGENNVSCWRYFINHLFDSFEVYYN